MLFVSIVILLGAVVSALMRSMVLSQHATKFSAHDVWLYDAGARHAWLAFGILILIAVVLPAVSIADWAALIAAWLVSASIVWTVPPWLQRFL